MSSTTTRVRNLLRGVLRVLDDLFLPLVDVMICSKIRFGILSCEVV